MTETEKRYHEYLDRFLNSKGDKIMENPFKKDKDKEPGQTGTSTGPITGVLDQQTDPNKQKYAAGDPRNVLTKQELDPTPQEGDQPSNPYKNFQDLGSQESEIRKVTGNNPDARIYQVNRDHIAEEGLRRTNMTAKEEEIKAPGSLTQAEANALMAGMPLEKQKEIQAQVLERNATDLEVHTDRLDDINILIQELIADNTLGRNERREQLRRIRQQIQEIEVKMDQNRI